MTAPRRSFRALLAVSATIVLGAFATVPAHATPAQDPGDFSGADDAALLDLVSCMNTSKHLAVTFVFDESRSLKKTDPEDRRVAAALTALDGLSILNQAGGDSGSARVDVSLAAFSDTYDTVLPWTTLNAEARPTIRRSVESFRTRDDGTETDLVTAMSGARDSLEAHTAELTAAGTTAPCNAILLFTDGAYSLNPRAGADAPKMSTTKDYAPGANLTTVDGVKAAQALGKTAMCRDGGLADQIRAEDISVLSVMLAGDAKSGDEDFLRSLTTGRAGNVNCGRPTQTPQGTFLSAADADTLVLGFDEIATRLSGGTIVPGTPGHTVCGTEPCPEGTRTFEVDGLTRRVRIMALADGPGLHVRITSPAGDTTVTAAGPVTLGAIKGDAQAVADRGFAVTVDRPSGDGAWAGSWTVEVLDGNGKLKGRPATVQVYTFSDITVQLDEGVRLVRGEAADLKLSLVMPGGVKAADVVAAAKAKVRIDDPITAKSYTVDLAGPPAGPYEAKFTVPANVRSNAFRVTGEVEVTTKEGSRIVARSPEAEFLVRRAGGAVQLAPAALDFPTLTGSGSTTSDLILIGGKTAGCVWFGTPKIDGPSGAGAIEVRYDGRTVIDEASCIPVPVGKTVTVEVDLHPASRATGAVRGRLEVHEKTEGMKPSVTDVQFAGSLARGVDEARRLVLVVVLMIVGLALPLVLLIVINAIGARFQDLDAIRGAVIPVVHSGTDVLRMDRGRTRSLALQTSDFASLAGTGNVRRFTFGGIDFRAHASRNPFGATAATAAPEGGAEKLKGRVGRKVELDAGLAGSWIFLLDPDRTRRGAPGTAEGRVIAFAAEGASVVQYDKLLADVRRRLPAIATNLGDAVRQKTTKPTKSTRRTEAEAGQEPDLPDAVEAGDASAVDPAAASSGAASGADNAVTEAPVSPGDPMAPAGPGADQPSAPPASGPTTGFTGFTGLGTTAPPADGDSST